MEAKSEAGLQGASTTDDVVEEKGSGESCPEDVSLKSINDQLGSSSPPQKSISFVTVNDPTKQRLPLSQSDIINGNAC